MKKKKKLYNTIQNRNTFRSIKKKKKEKNQSDPITIGPAAVFLRVFNRRSIDYARFDSSLVLPEQSGNWRRRAREPRQQFQETATR